MAAISAERAVSLIKEHGHALGTERVPFQEAYGRVLREPIRADRDFPPFDRVMMDGIAVRGDEISRRVRAFRSIGVQRAGVEAAALTEPGTCFEVMTGAVLPEGAGAVIPIERVAARGAEFQLEKGYEPVPGQFIHVRGSDNLRGDTLLEEGVVVGGKEMALIATCGYAEVTVTVPLEITIVSTGDELVEVDKIPAPYQIRKSNAYALAAACQALAYPVRTRLRHLPDDRAFIAAELPSLLEGTDMVLFSGGISKGKYDFMEELLGLAGVERHFHWVRQRPGKPLWFGTSKGGIPVFALPGNPNSTLTCFRRYVTLMSDRMTGLTRCHERVALLKSPFAFDKALTLLLPASLEYDPDGRMSVEPVPPQNSGDLTRLPHSDGFIELPEDQEVFPAGFPARFFPW